MDIERWFLSAAERGNPWTWLDRRHPGNQSWSEGNQVTPLVHGSSYFPRLLECIEQLRAGDLLMFTDWRGDPDQLLAGEGTEVSRVLCRAASRAVIVKGLVWRSHLDRFSFSEQENRHLGEEIEAAGGECLRDMRVRPGGSHHQKFVVLRHPGRPELDVAFVGGIDLCHSRQDDPSHTGDLQRQPMAKIYGPRPPWHDVQLEIRGPAVGDVETVFRERWQDPTPLTRNPVERIIDLIRREDSKPGSLPEQLPDPERAGTHRIQLLRTYPKRRPGFPFAPEGERSVARAYQKVVRRAQRLIYVEDQYFWNGEIVQNFAEALRRSPELRLIVVIPHYPDQDGRVSKPPNLVGRQSALDVVRAAGGSRVGIYGLENRAGTPVYVHAKVCVVDDTWASVGSDNLNRRSWTHDSELSCAVLDEISADSADQAGSELGPLRFARELRLLLAREHLEREDGDDADLCEPADVAAAFAASAAELQAWHDGGRRGPRPAGRLRPYQLDRLSASTLRWADPLYRLVYDPDGRPRQLRRAHQF
jgi:phosphatidylserine/phosphatidylglycerophosphate/cardiolipin synthase-like enzyme